MYQVYNVMRLPLTLKLGKEMEQGAKDIGIDCTVWREAHPGMTVVAYHIPPGKTREDYYPVDAEMVGNVLVWHVGREDTAVVGHGVLEIIGIAEGVEDVSATCRTTIEPRATGVSGTIPEGGSAWATRAVEQTAINAKAAQDAMDKYPRIGDNGNWWLWDVSAGKWVDSGVPAKGQGGGGSGCECVPATDDEVLAALLEAGGIPALTVDGVPLAVDGKILMV